MVWLERAVLFFLRYGPFAWAMVKDMILAFRAWTKKP